MRKPLREKSQRGAPVSRPFTLPAPTGGWFVGANMAVAPIGTAHELINAFPLPDSVRVRRGTAAHATGMTGAVASLIRFTDGAQEKFFAVANGGIYDVTDAGAVGAALVTGLTSDVVEYVQFANSGATWLIVVNGANAPQLYSAAGGWVTSPAITGMSGVASHVSAYKNRLYLVQSGTLNVWYLAVNAIGGAATNFPMQGVFTRGGSILCTAGWSISSANGVDEAFVAISSEGEVAVYVGSDPTAWSLSGLYRIPRPLGGAKCAVKAGGDLMIMTEEGIIPLSKAVSLDQIAMANVAITQRIAPAWLKAVQERAGLPGWQLVMWPAESMGVVSLPKKNTGDNTQFVVNARTGSWCKYVGYDANCFAVFGDRLFYGDSNGRVMRAEVGGSDDGKIYTVTIFPAFTDAGVKAKRKQVHMVRAYFTTNFSIDPQVTINADFDVKLPRAPSSALASTSGARWGTARWGVDVWPRTTNYYADWKLSTGVGVYLAPIIQLSLSNTAQAPDIKLTAIDILGEAGNIL